MACGGGGSTSGGSSTPSQQAPAITTQPTSQAAASVGATVTFTAAASGDPAPAYQWERSIDGTAWTAISGATSASYSFQAAALDNGSFFHVKASNAAGNATSHAASLLVGTPVTVSSTSDTTTQTSFGSSTNLAFTFPQALGSQVTSASILPVDEASLPVPAPIALNTTHPKALAAAPTVTAAAATNFVMAFTIAVTPATVTQFSVPVDITGGTVGSTIPAGSTLTIAMLQNSSWVPVSNIIIGTGGLFSSQTIPTPQMMGIVKPGLYLVYLGSTLPSNLGVALIADDGHGSGSASGTLQVVHLYNTMGQILPTPTLEYLPFPSAYDLDGAALTPDGSQGILVDGGNTIRFFQDVQTGVPLASTNTLDISAYGGDGDSVAIMPDGREAVVSGDSSSQLVLVSGIKTGSPALAEVINIPGARDGVVISNDGAVMLAGGSSGVTVFSVAPVATPTPGSLGGMVYHTFTQTADLTTLPTYAGEDGRRGLAISPADSSRAVAIGMDSTTGSSSIALITGLPKTPVVHTLAIPGTGLYPTSVAISLDGKMAVVGTSGGLYLFSGVDGNQLTQVGTGAFQPSFSVGSNAYTLSSVSTLGLTLDGKYAVVCTQMYDSSFTSGNGVLLVIPFSSAGFSNPVAQLNDVAVPDNDQLLLH